MQLGLFFAMNRIRKLEEFSDAGWMPLHYAAVGGSTDVLLGLLDAKVNPNCATTKPDHTHFVEAGATALMICAYFHGEASALQQLLDFHASVNLCGFAGNSALAMSVFSGNHAAVEVLLNRSAFIDQRNLFDNTALFLACSLGRECHVRMLLEARASMIPNVYGQNPLHQVALGIGERDDQLVVQHLVRARCSTGLRIRIPPKTLHGLVSHSAQATYRQGRAHSFEWVSGRMSGSTPLALANYVGNRLVARALQEDLTADQPVLAEQPRPGSVSPPACSTASSPLQSPTLSPRDFLQM